jgi:hypothetical protein
VLKLASFTATVTAVLFCAATALAQQCANNISPGETCNFQQATIGQGTNAHFALSGLGFSFVDGTDIPNSTPPRVEAAAYSEGTFGSRGSATAEIDYVFSVPGRTNSQVTATVSGQISWYGILLSASIGSAVPSVTGTFSLVDLGTDGKVNNLVANQVPLSGNINTLQFTPTGVNINLNGGFVNGGSQVSLQAQVTVGHVYEIQYILDCEAHSGLAGGPSLCDFTPTLPFKVLSAVGIPDGDYRSTVDSLSITLGPDQYGTILGIKAEVDTLSAKIIANDQDIAAAKLALEQENAQLLGLLNEIKSLLSALQSDPPTTSTPAKAKASNPRPPTRPVSPRTMDPP